MKKLLFTAILFFTLSNSYSQYVNYFFFEEFLNEYVSKDGYVDYDAIYENQADLDYVIKRFEQVTVLKGWTESDILAHWTNVYNAYSIKLIVSSFPVKSIRDLTDAFELKYIPYQGKKISLNYIEKEILSTTLDARIHFAINCASLSCPNINRTPFYGDTIYEQLDLAAKKFVNDMSKNNISKREIQVSKIFDWFAEDFLKDESSIIAYINKYSDTKIKNDAKISYLEYNWSLNSQQKFISKEVLVSK